MTAHKPLRHDFWLGWIFGVLFGSALTFAANAAARTML